MLNIRVRMLLIPSLALIAAASIACSSSPEPAAAPPPAVAPVPPPTAVLAAPAQTAVSAPPASKVLSWSSPPAMEIDVSKNYTAVFELEKGGKFTVELYAKEVPNTINSFVFLSRQGFYDGVTFHRVLEGFMAQGGDPTGTGTGGPGYKFDNEIHPDLRHDSAGILSMANSGVRNGRGTNGSQFFITFLPTPALDGHGKDCTAPRTSCHTVFGKVIEGMDVVNNISLRNPQAARTPGDAIKTITIIEN